MAARGGTSFRNTAPGGSTRDRSCCPPRSVDWLTGIPCPRARAHPIRRLPGVVNGTNYPAYSFSNRSEDILGIFAWGCDLMGVRWRRASHSTISIARRRDVAILDHVMGVSDV